jgi:hypothetical protein
LGIRNKKNLMTYFEIADQARNDRVLLSAFPSLQARLLSVVEV